VLGAFDNAEWSISRAEVEPGQQIVLVTDGITEAQGPDGRFGEMRLRAHLSGADTPALAVQRLEGSLHAFTEGRLEDDVAILAVARASTERSPAAADVLIAQPAPAGTQPGLS
jgi:serine phosphatase RsbU (regulator of sigma subunit)